MRRSTDLSWLLLVVVACWLTPGMAGAGVPPAEPPKGGGEPFCEEELLDCYAEREEYLGLWSQCSADFAACEEEWGLCVEQRDTCFADLLSKETELLACIDDRDAFDDDWLACEDELAETTGDFGECLDQLTACETSTVTFPATGQVTCYTQAGESVDCDVEAGEDGYWQAGGRARVHLER